MLTIITASYNSEKTIKRTIDSLLNQTNTQFEYIIVDGNSTDTTVDIIQSFEEAFKTKGILYKWISEPDKGIYDAWNKGLKMATGNWISFLGSDDYYLDNALEIYSRELNKFQNVDLDIIYSNVNVVSGNKTLKTISGKWSWSVFKGRMNIAHVGAFHSANYFEKYGFFDISYKIAGDYEMLLRAGHILKTLKVNEITAIMGAEGVSNNNISKVLKETLRAKHQTAGVNYIVCLIDYIWAMLKFEAKKILHEDS
ncbi:glycosyltransferase family 2 protein [Aestuariibaculum sp. YM273]|uniref:glycosyltransferase family 2 protein n=1 Tax=Aestuariibaculum sp. YM273 TaxID=3070659 RepID=UPI0027DDB370|nr:glycosyltransferase family 2 protein [Aestuariibaculum sp. YM273]WMI66629.1 glycosyltransferase family 2 protein [Aestuariibaculum sp. YM273]